MEIIDYIKPVPVIAPDDFRRRFGAQKIESFNLVDVRQPGEYEAGHMPGARLAPLGELQDHVQKFDRDKPTVIYCAIGGRSTAAASIFLNAGFREVYSLEGGYQAWNGPTAKGSPSFGTLYFRGTADPLVLLSLSWALEENTIRYYKKILSQYHDIKTMNFFTSLISVEVEHKELILSLYNKLKGQGRKGDFPDIYSSIDDIDNFIEGGLKLPDILAWAEGRPLNEIIDYSIGLEAQLFDVYTKILGEARDSDMRLVLTRLANEEKQHLNRFIRFYEEFL